MRTFRNKNYKGSSEQGQAKRKSFNGLRQRNMKDKREQPGKTRTVTMAGAGDSLESRRSALPGVGLILYVILLIEF